jgi:hypothetical protein
MNTKSKTGFLKLRAGEGLSYIFNLFSGLFSRFHVGLQKYENGRDNMDH